MTPTQAEHAILSGAYSGGWLCFESSSSKRRLVRFPERWRESSDRELQRLLDEALPAPRSPQRFNDELDARP